jgi:hypothetical protein
LLVKLAALVTQVGQESAVVPLKGEEVVTPVPAGVVYVPAWFKNDVDDPVFTGRK